MSTQAQIVDLCNDLSELTTNVKNKNLVRGEDPNDLDQRCLLLCQKYLGANWRKLTVDDIEVRRLTGGMSNLTYRCRIVDTKATEENEPHEVAIRFYGFKLDFSFNGNQDRFEEAIVGLLASEENIGPHVIGLFKEGQIHKYYQHQHLTGEDLNDRNLLHQLAYKVARFHALKAPVPKDYDYAKAILKGSVSRMEKSPEKFRKLFEKYDCKALMETNMSSEVEWLLELIPTLNSPTVFCHNDLRFANIMVTEEKEVVIGDIETFAYGKRGLDFATLFDGMDLNSKGIKEFIEEYIREREIINGKNSSEMGFNTVDHILEETKKFSIVYQMVMINGLVHNDYWKAPISESVSMVCLIISESD